MRIFRIFFLGALLAAQSCAGSSNPEPLMPCAGPITPSVTAGTTPRFTWTPHCGLSEIVVNAAPTNGGIQTPWDLKAGATLLGPGIDYGVTPSGATSITGPFALQQGLDHVAVFI